MDFGLVGFCDNVFTCWVISPALTLYFKVMSIQQNNSRVKQNVHLWNKDTVSLSLGYFIILKFWLKGLFHATPCSTSPLWLSSLCWLANLTITIWVTKMERQGLAEHTHSEVQLFTPGKWVHVYQGGLELRSSEA